MGCENVSESCGKEWPILATTKALPQSLYAIVAQDDGLVIAGARGYLARVLVGGEVQEHSVGSYGDIKSDAVDWPEKSTLHTLSKECRSLSLSGNTMAVACMNTVVTGTATSLSGDAFMEQTRAITAVFGNDNMLWAGDSLGGIFRTNRSAISWSSRTADMAFLNKEIYGGAWEGGDVFYAVGQASLLARHDGLSWINKSSELNHYYDPDMDFRSIFIAEQTGGTVHYLIGGNRKNGIGIILRKQQGTGWTGLIIPGEQYFDISSDSKNLYVVGSKGTSGVIRCRPLDG
jgi:predicted lipoprotein with Yx(FWY)xxD motif